jgi:hypothetical protein
MTNPQVLLVLRIWIAFGAVAAVALVAWVLS